MSAALNYCMQRQHLRRTVTIALVVGCVLTAINQLDVILRGDVSSAVPFKVAGNFIVPFVVSNLGLLSGRPRTSDSAAAPEPASPRKPSPR